MSEQQEEYLDLKVLAINGKRPKSPLFLYELASKLGEQGWELVNMEHTTREGGQIVSIWVFKRPFPFASTLFLAGQDLASFNPGQQQAGHASAAPEQLAAAFARSHQEPLARLEHLVDQDLIRRAHYSELGSVTLAQLLHAWAAHDLMHTVQAEHALTQPFIIFGITRA